MVTNPPRGTSFRGPVYFSETLKVGLSFWSEQGPENNQISNNKPHVREGD